MHRYLLFVVFLWLPACSSPSIGWQPGDGHPASTSADEVAFVPPANVLAEGATINLPDTSQRSAKHHDHHDHGKGRAEGAKGQSVVPKDYPLDVCIVSGEKLGSMGKPVMVEHGGRKAWLCCKGCVEDFHETPAKFLKKLDDANAHRHESAKPQSHEHQQHNKSAHDQHQHGKE